MRDDTLRVACRARSVVQGDWAKLVFRQGPVEIRIAFPQERFVIHFPQQRAAFVQRVVDVDYQWLAFQHDQRAFDHGAEFTVGDQHFCFPMRELESDGFGIKPDIQRVQHSACHRHTEMRLVDRGNIGGHDGDRIARADTTLRQGRGKASASSISICPGAAPGAMNNSDPIGINRRGLRQEAQRRQRRVICEALTETVSVWASSLGILQ